jgi:hypothetical protein
MNRLSKIALVVFFCSSLWITACSDDESFSAVDNQIPSISMDADLVHLEYGMTANIKAKITDADGIRSINIKNPDLYLNKTIDILRIYGDQKTEYDLDYNVTPNDTLKLESFPFEITVEDLVGNVATATFTANMDGDFSAPTFISKPDDVINVIFNSFNFKFSVSDNVVVQKVIVSIPELEINDEITNDSKEFEYAKRIQLGAEKRDYKGVIEVYDAFNNTVKKEFTISRNELQDYEKMYLCDVAEEDLSKDICGVPMLIDHTGEFEYTAYYYNETAGTEIRFIPQKNSFSPICIGVDATNSKIFTLDPEQALPLKLDQANVYYKIVFNTSSGSYATSTYTVDEAVDPLPHELGSNDFNLWDDKGVWDYNAGVWTNPDNNITWAEFKMGILIGKPFDITDNDLFSYHPKNKHIIQVLNYELKAGSFSFRIHNYHTNEWWDYCSWKVEKATPNDPERWVYTGKYQKTAYDLKTTSYDNDVEVDPKHDRAELTIPKAGKYDIIFDIHLGRMKIVPSKQ